MGRGVELGLPWVKTSLWEPVKGSWESQREGVISGHLGGGAEGFLLSPGGGGGGSVRLWSSESVRLWETDVGLGFTVAGAALCLQSGLDPVMDEGGGAE